MTETILLLGNYRPSLTLARTLAPLGYRLIISRGLGEGACEHSRYISDVWDHPPLSDRRGFAAALTSLLLDRPDIRIIYPVLEDYLICLSDIQPLLPSDRTYVMPDHDMVSLTLDKARMTALAEENNVPVARHRTVETRHDLHEAAEEIGYPLVVRPEVSGPRLNGRKALIAHSAGDLTTLLPTWPDHHRRLLVQRYVAGERVNHYLAARKGELVRLAETHIHMTEQPDGTGLAVHGTLTDVTPALESATARLMKALDYTGIGLAQYMHDAHGNEITFLEFNCRISGSHMIAEAAGLDLGRLAIDFARDPLTPAEPYTASGTLPYVWTYGAVRGTRAALSDGELTAGQAAWRLTRELARGLLTPHHMTWDMKDPMPTLALFASALLPGKLTHRVFPSTDVRPLNKSPLT